MKKILIASICVVAIICIGLVLFWYVNVCTFIPPPKAQPPGMGLYINGKDIEYCAITLNPPPQSRSADGTTIEDLIRSDYNLEKEQRFKTGDKVTLYLDLNSPLPDKLVITDFIMVKSGEKTLVDEIILENPKPIKDGEYVFTLKPHEIPKDEKNKTAVEKEFRGFNIKGTYNKGSDGKGTLGKEVWQYEFFFTTE